MLLRKIEDRLTARCNRGDLRIEPVDPLIGIHVQLGHKAAPDKSHSDFCHGALPPREAILLPAALRKHHSERLANFAIVHSNEPFFLATLYGSIASQFDRQHSPWRSQLLDWKA